MLQRPPRSTLTYTPFPHTALFRFSRLLQCRSSWDGSRMSKAAVKPAKKSFADFDMDAMDFSAVPANTEFKAAGRFQRLPLADIDPDPAQVRREFDQAEIDALAATIKDRGLLQPIVVAPPSNGRYIIRYGERRYPACGHPGFDRVGRGERRGGVGG